MAIAERLTIQQVDQALAAYTRAQLTLAALSATFYGVSMALLGSQLGGLAGAIVSVPAVAVFRIAREQRAWHDTAPVALLKP